MNTKSDVRMFFVTDIHGSDICFRKLLKTVDSAKKANVLVVGGDIAGKVVVPVIQRTRNVWVACGTDGTRVLDGEDKLRAYEQHLADLGMYAFRCAPEMETRYRDDPQFREETLKRLIASRLRDWVELADSFFDGREERIFVNAGNDDPLYVDNLLDQSNAIVRPEGRVIQLSDHLVMISCGFANMTPWNCPRDIPDDLLEEKIESMVQQASGSMECVFNLHAPPFGTLLDKAPELDGDLRPQMGLVGVAQISVGSRAVRRCIERHQPVVGLHGHIHECFAQQKIGRTICFNPGSEYVEGKLRGVFLEFSGRALTRYGLTRER